jgi:hypothetical protein
LGVSWALASPVSAKPSVRANPSPSNPYSVKVGGVRSPSSRRLHAWATVLAQGRVMQENNMLEV